MLVPLSVLTSSVSDGGLVLSVALIIVCLLLDQPTGGFPTVRDGIISTEGLELGLSTLSPSSQLEEKHQQHVSPHLLQYLQYLPKKFVFMIYLSFQICISYSHCICGIGEGLWWIPKSLACGYICFRSNFCVHTGCLAGCPPFSGFYMTPLGLFPCTVLLCPGVSVLNHGEFSPCGLNLDLHL